MDIEQFNLDNFKLCNVSKTSELYAFIGYGNGLGQIFTTPVFELKLYNEIWGNDEYGVFHNTITNEIFMRNQSKFYKYVLFFEPDDKNLCEKMRSAFLSASHLMNFKTLLEAN